MTDTVNLPSAHSMAWTTVLALRDLGGSGSIEEIVERAVAFAGLTEEQQSVPHSRGSRSEVEYRLAWARTLAKAIGLVDNSGHGVWTLTELGKTVTEEEVKQLKRKRANDRAKARREAKKEAKKAGIEEEDSPDELDDADEDDRDWKAELLDVLKDMDPTAFERLTKRLLREAGFINVSVTGGGGDGGIDGVGVYRMSLVSFPVYFQCKRYKDSVGSSKVRDFRGAMAGRGDKGLLITTGTFTADAKSESTRDGVPPIDLIDGDYLTELLRQYGLGVKSVERKVYDVTIQPEFFATI